MHKDRREIELIARGVLVADNNLLLCHTRGAWNTYLPGGHIEHGESAPVALAREIDEEMGWQVDVESFLGAVEHAYERDGSRICEINLVFSMRTPQADPERQPPSCEDYIEFQWQPLDELASASLQPSVLQTCLPQWLGRAGQAGWASTL